jgi:hypothetical protein
VPTGTRKKRRWEDRFFEVFEDSGLVVEAAKAAGISRTQVYRTKAEDEDFAARWAEVEEWSTEQLEQIAYKRAADGDTTLVIFLLKARRPDVYRESQYVQHGGTVTHTHEQGVNDALDAALGEVDRLASQLADVASNGSPAAAGAS